ncbi:PRTRC system protein E [Cupriavidus basilensis]
MRQGCAHAVHEGRRDGSGCRAGSFQGRRCGVGTPLALTASPAELDEGFAQAIASVSVTHRSLAEQVEAYRFHPEGCGQRPNCQGTESADEGQR